MVKSDAAARWSLKAGQHAQSQGTTESTVRKTRSVLQLPNTKLQNSNVTYMQSDITNHVLIVTNFALTTQYTGSFKKI